ncbi:MAG: succinate dehydrogenase assembly factor 2 [Alphaproteobacteria bacterium]|tara:strand:+ start:247 stop:513 length:267 start_codon:yes stop_codon:yes gene_type:complete
MFDSKEKRVRRLVYQASYTGMKETDLLLGQFAKKHLPTLTDEQLDMFEALLDAGDPSIFAWVRGDEDVPAEFQGPVLDMIKDFHISQI